MRNTPLTQPALRIAGKCGCHRVEQAGSNRQEGNAMHGSTWHVGAVLPAADVPPLGAHAITIGSDGRIAALAPCDPSGLTAAQAALVAMPALANAHDHGRGLATLACGVADAPLEHWMIDLARQPARRCL
jgi:hypothetical protein